MTVCVQVRVEVAHHHEDIAESELRDEEHKLRQQLEEEARVSHLVEEYLKKHYEELAGQVDHWMTKHEQDLDMKTRDLHDLKVCIAWVYYVKVQTV